MALLDQDEELLAKLREETAGRSDLELPAIDLSASQAPLGGQQVSPGFGVLEAQQGLPSAAAEAPTPSVAEIIKQGIAQQTAQKKPSRLEQLASAIRGGGEAVGEGLGKVGAGIGKVLGGGAPAESDGYDRAGHAFYAAMTGQKLPQSFFQKVKGPDKELVGLEKELRRAEILKALRGEPVKPLNPMDDPNSDVTARARAAAKAEYRRQPGGLSPENEALIDVLPASKLAGSSSIPERGVAHDIAQLAAAARQTGLDQAQTRINNAQAARYDTAVKDVIAKQATQENKDIVANLRAVNERLGGVLANPQAQLTPEKKKLAEKAFGLQAKVEDRMKLLPEGFLREAQKIYEDYVVRQKLPPEKAWSLIGEQFPEVEQLRIEVAGIMNSKMKLISGGAVTPAEADRLQTQLGTQLGSSPAGQVYALQLVSNGVRDRVAALSSNLPNMARRAGPDIQAEYDEAVKAGNILTADNLYPGYSSAPKAKSTEDLSAFKSKRPDKPVVEPTPTDAQPVANVPDSQDQQTVEALVARDQAAGIPAKSKFEQAMIRGTPPKTPDVVPAKAQSARTRDSLKAAGFKRQLRKSDGAVVWRNPATGEIVEDANVQ